MRANPIRFTGMASGMDTDSIVKDMLRPQQYKIDKEKKAQALVKLKQDAWKDMNKKLFDFHTKFTEKMSRQSTYEKNKVTVSNSGAIDIANETAVPAGTHIFENITMATATYVTGVKIDVDANTKISQLMDGEAGKNGIALKMTVAGEEITVIAKADDTLDGVAQRMNQQLKGTGFTARYDAANGRFFLNSSKTGEQSITFDSVNEITTPAIEAKPAEGENPAVVAVPAQVGDEIIGGLKKLGLYHGDDEADKAHIEKGKGSSYTYNGILVPGDTNEININGIKATIKSNSAEPITITSEPNSDTTYDFIKEFVTEYNNLLDDINMKLGAKPGKDIEPLTAEEREAMSDSEIKLWDEKLNSSLFYKDPDLTAFVDSMRSVLSNQFGGDLAKYGIVTGNWEEKGKLHIMGDEDDGLYSGRPNKLREALNADPEALTTKMLEIGKTLYKGIDDKLIRGNQLKSAMNFYNDKVMADKMKTSEKLVSTLEERMYKMEEMQYRKFAAMEKMLSTLNNQGSWLAQQFGG